jgi:hypothetical protein
MANIRGGETIISNTYIKYAKKQQALTKRR